MGMWAIPTLVARASRPANARSTQVYGVHATVSELVKIVLLRRPGRSSLPLTRHSGVLPAFELADDDIELEVFS